MVFGFRKTATAVTRPERQIEVVDSEMCCGTSGTNIQTYRCFRYVTSLKFENKSRGFSLVGLIPCSCVNHDVSKVVSSTWKVKRSHVILVRPLKPFKIKVLGCFETSRPTQPTAHNHTSEDLKPQQRRSKNLKPCKVKIFFRLLREHCFLQTSPRLRPLVLLTRVLLI